MSLLRKYLFCLKPETAHHQALFLLKIAFRLGLLKYLPKPISHPLTVMGLHFPNPLGLAAGFDKNGDYIDALGALGFGFIEIGTVTPKPQMGNPKPRLFRLSEEQAIINRMGFNNKGLDYVVGQLRKTNYRGILGINIGKNKDTPAALAVQDYVNGFKACWPYASYITINISSPNTPGLRDLHETQALTELLSALKAEQEAVKAKKYLPLVVKISPDLSEQQLAETARVLLEQKIDGVIVSNTTVSRQGIEHHPDAQQAGGLSGQPLYQKSTELVAALHTLLQAGMPIIACGGVIDKADFHGKQKAGAVLVQVYTGFVFKGLKLVHQLLEK